MFVSPALQRGKTRCHNLAPESRRDDAMTFHMQESIKRVRGNKLWRVAASATYTTVTGVAPVSNNDSEPAEEEFFPRGAIAFFTAMIAAYGLIWLAIYFLLLHRQSGSRENLGNVERRLSTRIGMPPTAHLDEAGGIAWAFGVVDDESGNAGFYRLRWIAAQPHADRRRLTVAFPLLRLIVRPGRCAFSGNREINQGRLAPQDFPT